MQQQPRQANVQVPAPAPTYPERYIQLVKRLELDPVTTADLYSVLTSADIVLLCDDSTSMWATVQPEPGVPAPPTPVTRWDELKRLAATLIDFITATSEHGMDITFLNRPGVQRVTGLPGLQPLFADLPQGSTPLGRAIDNILTQRAATLAPGRQLLLVVATDGEPSDCNADQLFSMLNSHLSRNGALHVSAVELTDNEETMAYMDDWNQRITYFDNTDDYRTDLRKVKVAATAHSLQPSEPRSHTATERRVPARDRIVPRGRYCHARCTLTALSPTCLCAASGTQRAEFQVRLPQLGGENPSRQLSGSVQAAGSAAVLRHPLSEQRESRTAE